MIYFKLKLLIPSDSFIDLAKYIWHQNFVVNWCYFWAENWPSFSIHTAVVKELMYLVYLHLEYNFYHTCTEKVHLSKNVNHLWLILIFVKKCFFLNFLWFFTVITTDFCQIWQNPILRSKLWTRNTLGWSITTNATWE